MSVSDNFDQNELHNFNQHAQNWWDPEGEFGALHKINPLRLEFMQRHISFEDQLTLDIGCGGGILSESMAKLGAQVTAIDLAEDVLNVAKLHSLDSGVSVDYQLVSAEQHAADHPDHYDLVTCMEMLEHVPDPASIIMAATQTTRPGGYVFFSTLNRTTKAYLLGVLAAEYVLNLVPKGTHQHNKFIKPSELGQMARQAGLVLIDSAGINFNPLLKHYALSHNLDINYLIAFQKPATS